jgi:shikimate kinase
MGAGKSTVGCRLAEALGLRFHDLDDILSRRAGATITEIFDTEGESGFRRREAVLLDEYTRLPRCVLATGGGCVVRPENRAMLGERGFVVYLKTPVELQLQRLRHDTERPLLQAPDRRERLEGLADERTPLYESVADLVVEPGDLSPSAACERILVSLPGELRVDRASGAGP